MYGAAVLASENGTTAETVFGVGFGAIVLIVLVAALALFVAALVSILQSKSYTSAGKAVWILVVLAFPFLGTIVWFVWGRGSSFSVDRTR